eukprot:GEMP01015830.1.p1 GENE.GEMP01015830.1~~GEMP01015830.1.p1  ORF type:complete len:658 (+),score=210.80 GEMP01015830.1:27-2000(+)
MLRFLALAAVAAGAASDKKNRPVTKVINLLKDMQKQLEKEAEEDQDVYDKMQCWCTTNDKEKTQAIKDAEQKIDQLTGTVQELAAQSARLNVEIENLEKEVKANTEALDQATALRTKQLAEFNGEEKDLLQSISALKAALTVLSKHHPQALLQSDDTTLVNIASVLHHQMFKYSDMIDEVVTPSQKRILRAFIQAPYQSYGSQSGEIFGILKQMRETFESNLTASQREELENQKAYEGLKAAKEAEITAGQQQVDKKSGQLAEADENLAQSKEEIADTKASLSADERFLMDLKEKCQMTDQEWESRQKKRQDEIAAVSQALNILSGDDAHDTFSRTFSFVQVDSTRMQVSAMLKASALKFHDPALSTLASSVKLDAFTKVKEAIDGLIANLAKEKEDEVKHRDWCIGSFNENEREQTRTTRDHDDASAQIDDLNQSIATLTRTIEDFDKQVVELKVQLKRAGENRAAENKEFQSTVHDQRETQTLLQKALKTLKGFYSKKSFVQGPPPPAGFKSYENNAGGNSVLTLLQTIINDAKAMEAEALRAEADAQKAYEGFAQETNRSVEAKTKARINAQEDKAKREVDRSEALSNREGLQVELDQLSTEETDFHKSCDFVVKNFEVRQEARDEEIEALRQAKSILSGANFGFMQKKISVAT